MKTKFYTLYLLLISVCIKVNAQNANTTLSNLTAPTKVNENLLPDKNAKRNLGSATKGWKSIYINDTLFLNNEPYIKFTDASDAIFGNGAGAGILGNENSFFGTQTSYKPNFSSPAAANSFFGYQCGYSNYGASNSFFGASAGYTNGNGYENSFFGNNAGYNNFFGYYNCFFGANAGAGNTNGYNNCFFGDEAGRLNTTGNNNTYLGYHAGNTGTTGSSNTLIGYGADISNATLTNATALGNGAIVGASNHIHIGNPSVTSIGGQVSWSTFSDERIKNNIQQNVPGLQFINLLKPVTYHYDVNKQDNIPGKKTEDWNGKYDIEKIQFTGFVAQDVEAAAKKIGYDFSGVDIPKNNNDLYSLRYSDFVVPLVKAVQELSRQNDSLNLKMSEFENLKMQNQQLEQRLAKLEALMNVGQSTLNSQQSIIISSSSLSQNKPNPFSNSTTINYSLPQKYSSAKIMVTDVNGSTLKEINLSNTKGSVKVDGAAFTPGIYGYALYADGRLIASKQMIVSK